MFQDEVVQSISRVLESPDTRLCTLELNVCATIDLVPLANALKINRTLKRLHLCWDCHFVVEPGTNDTPILALRQSLRHYNFVLERLDIFVKDWNGVFGGREFMDPVLDFYLHLNKLGRQSLLGTTASSTTTTSRQHAREDWIQMLAKHRDNVSALFYYLSTNPMLCCESSDTSRSGRATFPTSPTSSSSPQRKRHKK